MINDQKMKHWKITIPVVLFLPFVMQAQKTNTHNEKTAGVFHTDIPAHPYNLILGRPTNHSISISLMANEDMSGYINYGPDPKNPDKKTGNTNFKKGQINTIDIDQLQPDKRYYYRFIYNNANSDKSLTSVLNFFQTPRRVTSSFTFTVQADSHLDENAGTDMYLKTLNNMAADSADFLIDLGDTWMTDKYTNDYRESVKQYIAQRYYFGSLCKSSALFLTLGNHDGESGQQLRKKNAENMTTWATTTRNNYYPNPSPNDFYSGNIEKENGIGFPKNYYAWEWGNALFIVLDPFRYTSGNNNAWQRTLGEQQYNWLKHTLQQTKAGFKFVFIHNLVGGADLKGKGRGGTEAAGFFEWGGLDPNGVNSFSAKRPGWEKPIHDLLVANRVNVVFHGHDHLFAKQDLDGIVYQLVPQPGTLRYGNTNSAAEYGYTNGKILNGPGYLRIRVEEKKAMVEFVQTSLDPKHTNREVLFTYSIPAK